MIAHFTAQDLKIYQVRQGRKLLNKLVWTYQTLQTKDRKNKTVIQTQSRLSMALTWKQLVNKYKLRTCCKDFKIKAQCVQNGRRLQSLKMLFLRK